MKTKTINKYVCEICNREYHTEQEAIQCEAEGKEIPLVSLYQDVLCLDGNGKWDRLTVFKIIDLGHYSSYELGWLCDEELNQYRPIETIFGNQGIREMCKVIDFNLKGSCNQ